MGNKPSQAEEEFLKHINTKTFKLNENNYSSALYCFQQKYKNSPKYANRTIEDIISWAKTTIKEVKFQSDANNDQELWSQMLEVDLIHQQANILWKEITSATTNLMNNLLKKLDFTETMNEIPSQDLQDILNGNNIKIISQRLTKKIKALTIIKDSKRLDICELFKIENTLMNQVYELIIQPMVSKLFLQYRFKLLSGFSEQELTSSLQKLMHEQFKKKKYKSYNWWNEQFKLESTQVFKEFEILFDQIDCQVKFQGSILIDLSKEDNLALKEFYSKCNSEKLNDIINQLSHQAFDRLKDRLIEKTLTIDNKQNTIIDNFLLLENSAEIFENSVKGMCNKKQKEKENIINTHYQKQIESDLPVIVSRQFERFDPQQFQYFIYFMIHCIPADSPLSFAEKVIPIIEYIASYSKEDNEQLNQIIQSLKNSIITNKHQELLKHIQKVTLENFKSFHSYLEKQAIIKENFMNCLLVQTYIAISNVKIDFQNKKVIIKPFFGVLKKYSLLVAQQFEQSYSQKCQGVQRFFNYLDIFIEERIVSMPGYNAKTINTQNIFINQNFSISKENFNDSLLWDIVRADKADNINTKYLVKEHFHQINYSNTRKLPQTPQQFFLKRVSNEGKRSRQVILAISGFLQTDKNKKTMWEQISSFNPNCEVYALQYEACKYSDFIFSKHYESQGDTDHFAVINKLLKNNLFTEAMREAAIVGKYLAHLIHLGILFPNCSVSIVGFSLGTQIILECLQEYDTLLLNKNQSIISSIVMLGGVADISKISNSSVLDLISCKFINGYCDRDWVLRYILSYVYSDRNPVGLKGILDLIPERQNKIQNIDFSQLISGHLSYMENLRVIFFLIEFNSLI